MPAVPESAGEGIFMSESPNVGEILGQFCACALDLEPV